MGINTTTVCFTYLADDNYFVTIIPYDKNGEKYCELSMDTMKEVYEIADKDGLYISIEFNIDDMFLTINKRIGL